MLSERDIELAHPEAFDFIWGNLPPATYADFDRHLLGCRHCQAVVDEYSEIGRIIKLLPPAVEPPADLEDRTVAGMVAALTELRATSDRPSDDEDRVVTRAYPILERPPPAEPEPEPHSGDVGRPAPIESQAPLVATRLPVWQRHQGRLVAIIAAAAAIVAAAIVFPLSLGGGQGYPGTGHGNNPAPCHNRGQDERLRGSHRASDSSPRCVRQLGDQVDRAAPEELRRFAVVRVLVRRHRQGRPSTGGVRGHVPRS